MEDSHGYRYGDPSLPPSPVTLAQLAELEASVGFTVDDAAQLRLLAEVVEGQIEQILDVWYGFVGSTPHLLAFFSTPAGEPVPEYLSAVRARFGRWILDTCTRPRDETWLAYQHEIALRHTAAKKNRTDGVSSVPHIPLRHVIALTGPITATMRPFLGVHGHTAEQVEAMHQAWSKAVLLQVALWARPYAEDAW